MIEVGKRMKSIVRLILLIYTRSCQLLHLVEHTNAYSNATTTSTTSNNNNNNNNVNTSSKRSYSSLSSSSSSSSPSSRALHSSLYYIQCLLCASSSSFTASKRNHNHHIIEKNSIELKKKQRQHFLFFFSSSSSYSTTYSSSIYKKRAAKKKNSDMSNDTACAEHLELHETNNNNNNNHNKNSNNNNNNEDDDDSDNDNEKIIINGVETSNGNGTYMPHQLSAAQSTVSITSAATNGASSSSSSSLRSSLLAAASILVYYCFSIVLTFYNRHLFVIYNFPLFITMVHLVFKFCAALMLRTVYDFVHRSSDKRRIVLDRPTFFRRIVPTGAASAADIGLSNWSLQYITITLYTMSKSTVILFIFFFSIMFKLEKWRRSIIAIVVCIASGLFLFTYHSTEFHLFGFVLVMIASFAAGLRWTLAQAVTQKHEIGLSNPIDMIFHIQPPMILFLLPLAVYIEGAALIKSEHFFQSNDIHLVVFNVFLIVIGAALAFVLEASEYMVVTYTSSLTLSITGIFKEICIIFLAVEINNNSLNGMNIAGLVMCLLGISIHVIVKARDQTKDAANANVNKPNERMAMRRLHSERSLSGGGGGGQDHEENEVFVSNDNMSLASSSSSTVIKHGFKTTSKSFNRHRKESACVNNNDQQKEPLLQD